MPTVKKIFVPAGKTLLATKGNYVFNGPCYAYLDGFLQVSNTYTDGSPWIIEPLETLQPLEPSEIKVLTNATDVSPQTHEQPTQRLEDPSNGFTDSVWSEDTNKPGQLDNSLRKPRRKGRAAEENRPERSESTEDQR